MIIWIYIKRDSESDLMPSRKEERNKPEKQRSFPKSHKHLKV